VILGSSGVILGNIGHYWCDMGVILDNIGCYKVILGDIGQYWGNIG
jgi:hypothetical protein